MTIYLTENRDRVILKLGGRVQVGPLTAGRWYHRKVGDRGLQETGKKGFRLFLTAFLNKFRPSAAQPDLGVGVWESGRTPPVGSPIIKSSLIWNNLVEKVSRASSEQKYYPQSFLKKFETKYSFRHFHRLKFLFLFAPT